MGTWAARCEKVGEGDHEANYGCHAPMPIYTDRPHRGPKAGIPLSEAGRAESEDRMAAADQRISSLADTVRLLDTAAQIAKKAISEHSLKMVVMEEVILDWWAFQGVCKVDTLNTS